MIGLVVISVALFGLSVVFGNKILTKQSSKLKDLRLQGELLEAQKTALAAAKSELKTYKDLEQVVNSVVPKDKDQARTVREISKIAEELGITIAEIRFSTSNLGQPAPKPTTTENNQQSSTTTSTTTPPSQVQPVKGITGVYSLEIIISPPAESYVGYQRFLNFLERLENNRRTAHVKQITILPKRGSDQLYFTLTLNAYVKP